jgi:hypothetical protein
LNIPCQPNNLVGDAGNHRQQREMHRNPNVGRRSSQKREHEDAQNQHQQHEAGAAARVQARLAARRLHRHDALLLQCVNRLVFRTVILEHAPNVGHQPNQPYIEQENRDSQPAVDHVACVSAPALACEPIGQQRRQRKKQEYPNREPAQRRRANRNILHRLGHRLDVGIVLNLHLAGEVERLDAQRERVDEHKNPAQQRAVQKLQLAEEGLLDGFGMHNHPAVGFAAGDGEIAGAAHHHAFDDRLPPITPVRGSLCAH